MSLTSSINSAASALELFSTGIQVTSNNIANASTPGYVREVLEIRSPPPARVGNLLIGNGVMAAGIHLQIDRQLERRIQSAQSDTSGATAIQRSYLDLETALQELGDDGLSKQLSSFQAALQNVASQPTSTAVRQMAIQQAAQLATSITSLRTRIDGLRDTANSQVSDAVNEANGLIDEIARLNKQIAPIESVSLSNSDAGTLRGQRYAALDRLSQLIPIRTVEQSGGVIDVFLGNEHLIIPGEVQHLKTTSSIDRGVTVTNVSIAGVNVPYTGSQGTIGGLLAGREQVLGGFVDQLDKFSSNLIFEFNKLHASGQGLQGYTSLTGSSAVKDVTASLDAAGLVFAPQSGGFDVRIKNQTTGLFETTRINIDLDNISSNGANTTLTSLAAQLNGVANLTATVTSENKLKLTTAAGYEVQFAHDDSNALAALGINTFFDGVDSGSIAVNSYVRGNSGFFAAALGGGAADNSNALKIADFANQKNAALDGLSLTEYYTGVVSTIGQASASQASLSAGYETFRDTLLSQKQQISGVSLDEELIQMMQYQHSYQAAARFVKAVDDLFNVLVNI